MRVGVQNDFDVGKFETEFGKARLNSGHGHFKAGIEDDVSLWGGDEKGTDAGGADVVDVADDAEGFERGVPGVPVPAMPWRFLVCFLHQRRRRGNWFGERVLGKKRVQGLLAIGERHGKNSLS